MLLVTIVFFVLMLMGMPVAFAIGIAGTLFFLQNPYLPFTMPVQEAIAQTQNYALLAVPLFIVAGNFMNHSGLTSRLLDLASVLTGRLKGGLAQVSLALSALMGGVSGSAIADSAMQARMLGGEMKKRGFTRGFAAGVIAFGSILTPTLPPGIGMIIYGSIGDVSIGRLFAAGIVPALIIWLGISSTVWVTAHRRGYQPELKKRPTIRQVGHSLRGGIWALLFPVFLLLGLRMGVFTPSEIGAFAVVYAIFIGIFIYRKLKAKRFINAVEDSLADVGSVMFLIALSAILSYGIVFEQIPGLITGGVLSVTDSLYGVMFLICVVTVILGFFIDATVLIIMLTPIFLPLIRQLGGDPVHFGIVFLISATIGNFTPPVGVAMYGVCSIMRCPIGEYTRESIPLFLTIVTIALLLVFVPQVVIFVPDLIFG